MDRLRDLQPRNLVGCAFIVAMMIAPFIALIYGVGFGLFVLTVGLALSGWLAADARDQVPTERRNLVIGMALVMFAMALLAGAGAIIDLRR